MFDGAHYNPAVSKEDGIKIFDPKDDKVYQGCLELAEVYNKKGEACDPSVFSLVCYQC